MSIPLNKSEALPSAVFIGIGANIGPVSKNFARALANIEKYARVLALSSLYESDPVGPQDQPKFTNAVIKVETRLSPFKLLLLLQTIEKEIGREKTVLWGPRVIDLDIIFYGDLIINTDSLVIPHPKAHERRFVMEPLLEIEPTAWHPAKKMAIRDICAQLKDSQMILKTDFPRF